MKASKSIALALLISGGVATLHADTSIANADRAAWAANATYHTSVEGRLDQVLALRFLRKKFDEDPRTNPVDALLALNSLEKSFGSRMAASQGNFSTGSEAARVFNDYLSVASGLFSISQPAVSAMVKSIAGPSATLVGKLYDSQFGPLEQVREQIQLSKSLEILGAGQVEEWAAAHDLASVNPGFAEVMDAFFGTRMRASVRDSASEIHAKNPAYSDHEAIREVLSEVRKGTLTRGQSEERLRQLQKSLAALLAERREHLQKIDGGQDSLRGATAERSGTPGSQDLQAAIEAARRRELDRLEAEALRAGWNTLGAVLSTFDPQGGRVVIQAGDAAFRLADAFSRYSETAATYGRLGPGIGTLVASSNIVNAALSLSSLFGGGLSSDALILGQIRLVRQELQQLRADMGGRFDRIDRSISQVLLLVSRRFDALDATIRDELGKPLDRIQQKIASIQGDIFEMGLKLDQIEGSLQSGRRSDRERALRRSFFDCAQERGAGLRSVRAFRGCLANLRFHATEPVSSEIYRGEELDSALARPISENVSFLAEYSSRHFGMARLSQSRSLPDFVDWANGAMAFASIYESNPGFWKVAGAEELDRILDSGAALGLTMKSLLALPSSDGPRADRAFFSAILAEYRETLDRLGLSIQSVRREFEIQELKGYSLESPNLSRLPAPEKLPACGRPEDRSMPVSFPGRVLEALPASVLIAEHLLPGRLRFCYQAEWTPPSVVRTGLQKIRSDLCSRYAPYIPGEPVISTTCTARKRQEYSRLVVRVMAEVGEDEKGRSAFVAGQTSGPSTMILEQGEICSDRGDDCFTVGVTQALPDDVLSHVVAAWNSILVPALEVNSVPVEARAWDFKGFSREESALQEGPMAAVQRHASTLLHEFFSQQIRGLGRELSALKSLDHRVRMALQGLSRSKKLLQGLMSLGLPESMASNDRLVSYFKGTEGLLDEEGYLRAFEDGMSYSDVLPTALRRLDAFEAFSTALVGEQAGNEDHPLVSRVMDRLVVLKRTRQSAVPRRPITDASSHVLKLVRELQSGKKASLSHVK
jgi:hypothetical protein